MSQEAIWSSNARHLAGKTEYTNTQLPSVAILWKRLAVGWRWPSKINLRQFAEAMDEGSTLTTATNTTIKETRTSTTILDRCSQNILANGLQAIGSCVHVAGGNLEQQCATLSRQDRIYEHTTAHIHNTQCVLQRSIEHRD